ncbi:zinc ABC transporter substrate-binding protein [Cronbergia sp. UHCC 0137]|uniref:metal ABC transporter solute-binding protein, Zn/Mn family n=1 Tax=Cronbergia sp. UHCC 0137 TaxID=3110239 RepID=UPI002B2182D1|nr:zinc ABC transporter substrate-binding protein [Cronbergia sp. UHCC 0137]MEA5618214.1 zinc ABC transporter substrate-binding protein [Cronbergia sp. UHCC 0137]
MKNQTISHHLCKASFLTITIGLIGCNNFSLNTTYIQASQTTTTNINKNLPQVVATTSVLCDLTKQIAGDTININCLIPPDVDPLVYQPTPEDRQAIEQAKLVLYHGYNHEPELIKIIKNTKNSAPKIAVAQTALPQPQKFQLNGKKFIDPHIWHNVKNTIKMVEVINKNIGKLSPGNSKLYNNNTKEITKELNQLHSWVKSRLASIPAKKRKLVTTHYGMLYYIKAYNMPYIVTLKGISNEEKLTNAKVKALAKNIQKSKAYTIFADTTTNPNLLEPIAKKANVQVFARQLYIDGLGDFGSDGETYQKMMDANTRSIVEGLGGTYLKFAPNLKVDN